MIPVNPVGIDLDRSSSSLKTAICLEIVAIFISIPPVGWIMSVEVCDNGDDEGNNHSSSSKQQYI